MCNFYRHQQYSLCHDYNHYNFGGHLHHQYHESGYRHCCCGGHGSHHHRPSERKCSGRGGHHGYGLTRRYPSPDEQRTALEEYIKQLGQELAGAEAALNNLKETD